jgi:hypothetical protein
MESGQEVPECLEPFKPELPPDAPLFDDDDDDDEDEVENKGVTVPDVSEGANWDAGDNSVAFQGQSLRKSPFLVLHHIISSIFFPTHF